MRIAIVGAGLFGSMAARVARAYGADVEVFDSRSLDAASKVSGGFFKPSWLNSISKERQALGRETLERVVPGGIEQLSLDLRGNKVRLDRVRPDRITLTAIYDYVVSVRPGGELHLLNAGFRKYDEVLVAAGVRSLDLAPCGDAFSMRALWGTAGIFRFDALARPSAGAMHMWAPFKQAIFASINATDAWAGDGATYVQSTWDRDDPAKRSIERLRKWFNLPEPRHVLTGARPYVVGAPAGLLMRSMPHVWVSTGGAKNGTMLAAVQAAEWVKEIGLC